MPLYIPSGSKIFESGEDNLLQASLRQNSVLSGLAVSAQAVPNMTVQVALGVALENGAVVPQIAVAALAIGAAHASLVRKDLVSKPFGGAPVVTQGVPDAPATVKPPALPANSILLAYVNVPASAANIQNANIENMRLIEHPTPVFVGTLANRPAFGNKGLVYFATDSGGGTLFRDSGIAWDPIGLGLTDVVLKSLGTTKGDIIVFTGVGVPVRRGVGADGTFLKADSAQADGVNWGALSSGDWVKIAESVLGADTATIDFASIPATYNHLMLVWEGRDTTAVSFEPMNLRFNNDSGANYDYEDTYVASAGYTNQEVMADSRGRCGMLCGTAASAADHAGAGTIYIPNYRRTTFRHHYTASWAVQDDTTAAANHMRTGRDGGSWRSTAAINRVTLIPHNNSFKAGSMAVLYGLN